MRVLVDNGAPELQNLGDLAMLVQACARVRARWPQAEVYTFASDASRLKQVLPGVYPVHPSDRARWARVAALGWWMEARAPSILPGPPFWFHALRQPGLATILARACDPSHAAADVAGFVRFLRGVDVYVWCGGGYLADPFGTLSNRLASTLCALSGWGVPSVAFGLGVGPLRRPRIRCTVRRAMRRLRAVGLREADSQTLLRSWKFPESRMRLTGDDAIGMALSYAPAQLGANLGVSFRVAYYTGFGSSDLSAIRGVLQAFCRAQGVALTSVPIAAQDQHSNAAVRSPDLGWVQPSFRLPDVLAAVATCRTLVTSSYHAAVFALSMGVPVLAIVDGDYYAQKFEGLRRQFGRGVAILSAQHLRALAGPQDNFGEALQTLWAKAPAHRLPLLQRAAAQAEACALFADESLAGLEARLQRRSVKGGPVNRRLFSWPKPATACGKGLPVESVDRP